MLEVRSTIVKIALTMTTFVIAAALASVEVRAAPQLFGSHEFATAKVASHAKWNRFVRQIDSAKHSALECLPAASGDCSAAAWHQFIDSLRGLDRAAQLDAVNRFFNKAAYVSDKRNYGTGDYWATPLQLLSRGGDCEDYAIAKYLALRELGIATGDMRIVVLKDQENNAQHAILTVEDGDRILALDNQIARVTDTRRIHYYRPLYAINESGWSFYTN
jgi:predicted transglutaminase-like cysteine proteinase